ncbi:hypothetical protein OF83DRAFT_1080000 [Amylostereum chailletii]|nr:hypothetical protein OF83DRAFT_1080000 [Amylostereum chailletii]
MKLSPLYAALAFMPAFGVSAPTSSASYGSSVGTVYFTNNEPSGNAILSADIGPDGKLSFVGATSTQGLGLHADNGGNVAAPDPLFSQGAIDTNAATGLLATVNAGSNTVSLFKVDSKNPSTLTLLGKPASTKGEFPVSVAFNKAGTQLCVLNGGAVGGVACFKPSKISGLSLEPQSFHPLALNQTTPPSGPALSASAIGFTEDQKHLVVAIKGVAQTREGYLAVYDVAPDGTVSASATKVVNPVGGGLPFTVTPIPGQQALFVADPATGVDIFDFSQGVRKSAGSPRTKTLAIPGEGAVCWSVYSPKTKNFYVSDILPQYPAVAGSGSQDLAIASFKGQEYLYVLVPNATSVDVFNLKGPGQAQHLQQLNFADSAQKQGVPINRAYLVGMAVFVKP